MGIKNLTKFLRTKYPSIFTPIHISTFYGKKIAIDTSLFMCKYKASSCTSNGWLESFISLIMCLRTNNVHCVFVFDSSSPIEKNEEQQKRMLKREKLKTDIKTLETDIMQFKTSRTISQFLQEKMDKYMTKNPQLKRILVTRVNKQTPFSINVMEELLQKKKQQQITIHTNDYQTLRLLLDIMGVPYLHALIEAETMCSDLCKRNVVDAVLTDDSDVFAYENPFLVTKLNIMTGMCELIFYEDILESMQLSRSQFLDFCIMCGTDYNTNIPNVGPSKSYQMIVQYGSIEDLNIDISCLRHERTRQLFTEYQISTITYIPFCKPPKSEQIHEFIYKQKLSNKLIMYVQMYFTPIQFI